ncbi:hypothetical protein Aperf_G00000082323 [Anoplocephala perfoliata]
MASDTECMSEYASEVQLQSRLSMGEECVHLIELEERLLYVTNDNSALLRNARRQFGLFGEMSYKDPGQSQPTLKQRLQKLDEIDSKVMQIMESSGGTLDELSKDIPDQKQIEIHTHNFRAAIRDVELELISQLNYLGQVLTGLPYEKNVYKETMDLSLASERLKVVQKILSRSL